MEKLALKSVGTSSLYGHPTDGKVINIPLSFNESKAVKFLKDAVKKTLKKTVLKAARKGKAPSEEVPKDTSVSSDKGSRANFWG